MNLLCRVAILVCSAGLTGCMSFVSDYILPTSAPAELAHFEDTAPATGYPGPDFALQNLEGETVALDDLTGDRPLLLAFASYTCPVVRLRMPLLEELAEEYGDRVRFALVYTIESHPMGAPCPYTGEEWDTMFNVLAGIRVGQAESMEQRRSTAQMLAQSMKTRIPILIDTMGNEVWNAYGRAPTPAFVFDPGGRITLRQVWFEPRGVRRELERLLAQRVE